MTAPADHSLNLDQRQRDMLAAMGVTYWWPEAVADTEKDAGAGTDTISHTAAVVPPTPPAASQVPARAAIAPPSVPLRGFKKDSESEANYSREISEEADFHSKNERPTAHPTPSLAALGWPELTQAIQGCTACGLCQGRKQAVPGMGNPQARWMIVGEAPGEQEDKQGLPFVGPAGQLLDAMLAAMGLTREADVYIANVIKCRPPHNRNPEPAEVAQCAPFLQRQIELVQPDLILALGRFAAQTVLAGVVPDVDKLPLGKLRGQVYQVDGRPVVVSYHPAYLLRSPAEKGKVWADLCLAMAHLGYNPLERYTPAA